MGGFFSLTLDDVASHVRHLAWLAATPEGEKQTRFESLKGTDLANIEPDEYTQYWLDEMSELGFFEQTGMGLVPVSWTEIKSWMDATGRHEFSYARMVRKLSEFYVSEYNKASDPNRPAPLSSDKIEKVTRDRVALKMKALVGVK